MDVKKLLKSRSGEILPDKGVKNAIARDLGIATPQAETLQSSDRAAVKVRRNATIIVASVAAVAIAAASTAVWLTSRQDGSEFIPSREFQFGSFSAATDFYAYSAVSMGGLLSSAESVSLSALSQSVVQKASEEVFLCDTSAEQSGLNDDQKAKVEEYLVFATGILGGGVIESSVVASDRAEYSYMLSAGYSDSFGTAANYVLYFNAAGNVKDDKYALEGVLVIGENTYPVEGKYECETEDDEAENEISFKAFTSQDKNSYINLKYENQTSEGEIESGYTIKVVKDGKQVEKTSISREIEEGQTTYEINIKRDDGDVKLEFEGFGEGMMGVIADFGGEQHKFGMTPVPDHEGGGFAYDFGWNFEGDPEKDHEEDSDKKPDMGDGEFDREPDRDEDRDDLFNEPDRDEKEDPSSPDGRDDESQINPFFGG